jgi:uncharacterized membrane protein
MTDKGFLPSVEMTVRAMEIKKIKKISLANIVALLHVFFAFIISFGIFIYLLVKIVLEKEMADKLVKYIFVNLGLDFLISLGVAVAIGVVGWIIGFIAAGMYNFFAREVGGAKIEFVDETGAAMVMKTEEKKQELFKY